MPIRFIAILALLFSVSVGVGHAATTVDTSQVRPPKPDFTPFAFLVGTWSCKSDESDRPGRQASRTVWRIGGTGYWLTGETDYPPVNWFPYEDKGQERITYDAAAGLWIYVNWRDMGGYNLYTTPGFTGDTAVWTDHSFERTKTRTGISTYTMKKISDTKYVGTFEISGIENKSVAFEDICTKS